MASELKPCQIADALEKCDWAGACIGNKAIVSLAIEALRDTRPAPAATDTGLVTVHTQVRIGPNDVWRNEVFVGERSRITERRELVTRSQAVELLAAKDREVEAAMVIYRAERKWRSELEAKLAAAEAENTRLRNEQSAIAKALVHEPPYQASLAKRAEQLLSHVELLKGNLSSAEKALEAREAVINNLIKHVDALPDDAEFVGSAATWASRLALMLGELRTVPEVPTILRSKVAEYIAARNDYELATKPNGSFGTTRHLKPNNPISVRYREARAALEAKP